MALIDLLLNGKVEEFNQTRGHRAPLDLYAADLSNLPLGGVDLSGANLQKADLSGSDLTDAVLAKSDLSGADLTGTILKGAMAIRSKWKEAYAGGADMSEADFTGADLSEADLTKAKVAHAQFQSARLKSTILEEADLSDCDFTEAKLSGANLKGARLVGSILREAKLAHADCTGADFTGADLTQARVSGAVLRKAILRGTRLVSADLTGCDFTEADVSEADFTRANLSQAVLEGVDLSKATTTDIEQGGGTHSTSADDAADKPELLHIDDPSVASHGDGGATAFLWDNAEDAEKSRLRVAVARPDVDFDGRAPALPIPSDLVLSSGIAAHKDGFATVALVERPGGVIASVTTVDATGKLVATASLKLGYTPAAKPVFRSENGLLHIYGISREGPGIQVHRWEGGPELAGHPRLAHADGARVHEQPLPGAPDEGWHRRDGVGERRRQAGPRAELVSGTPVRDVPDRGERRRVRVARPRRARAAVRRGHPRASARRGTAPPEAGHRRARREPGTRGCLGRLHAGVEQGERARDCVGSAPSGRQAVPAPRGRGRGRDGRALRGRRARRRGQHAGRNGLRHPTRA